MLQLQHWKNRSLSLHKILLLMIKVLGLQHLCLEFSKTLNGSCNSQTKQTPQITTNQGNRYKIESKGLQIRIIQHVDGKI